LEEGGTFALTTTDERPQPADWGPPKSTRRRSSVVPSALVIAPTVVPVDLHC
jgi:hypothetical protein